MNGVPTCEPVASARPESSYRVVRWTKSMLSWSWRVLVGGLFCFDIFPGIIATGWTYRWMQAVVLRGWWKKSRLRDSISFADLCDSLGPDGPVPKPRWFWQERIGVHLCRPGPDGRPPSTLRCILRGLLVPWYSLWSNFLVGMQALFCTFLLTGTGCLIMVFSWEFGWLNSFNKGYEQAWIGPTTGFLGIFLFIAAMYYVPMAQAHQATTRDMRAFFDFHFVWRLIQARLGGYVGVAALTALVSLLLEMLKTAPAFFDGQIDSWTNADDAQLLEMLNRYFLLCSFLLFLGLLLTRLSAAVVYRSAVLKVLRLGWVNRADLHPVLSLWLDRLDLHPTPDLAGNIVLKAVRLGDRLFFRRFLYAVLFLIWFAFVAKVYVGEFLNYHPVQGFLNHALVQCPSFDYVPKELRK